MIANTIYLIMISLHPSIMQVVSLILIIRLSHTCNYLMPIKGTIQIEVTPVRMPPL